MSDFNPTQILNTIDSIQNQLDNLKSYILNTYSINTYSIKTSPKPKSISQKAKENLYVDKVGRPKYTKFDHILYININTYKENKQIIIDELSAEIEYNKGRLSEIQGMTYMATRAKLKYSILHRINYLERLVKDIMFERIGRNVRIFCYCK